MLLLVEQGEGGREKRKGSERGEKIFNGRQRTRYVCVCGGCVRVNFGVVLVIGSHFRREPNQVIIVIGGRFRSM